MSTSSVRTAREQAVFLHKTRALYLDNRRCAEKAGRVLSYGLEDLRYFVETHLGPRACPYCRGPVGAVDFALDQRLPTARGGTFALRNLEVSCPECHCAKGLLDGSEFKEILTVLASWARPVRDHFLARLRGEPGDDPLPPQGTLEWFAGPLAATDPLSPAKEQEHEVSDDQPAMGEPDRAGCYAI